MIAVLFQSVLILTLFFTAYKLFFERFTFFQHNRFFLLSGLVLSFLLPLSPLNFSEERTEYVYLPKSAFENGFTQDVNASQSYFWQEWTYPEWLSAVYILGVAFFLALMIFQIVQAILLINRGELVKKDGLRMVITHENISPFSFFSTVVMNPKMLSEEQYSHIITHENTHINQWHQLDVVMAEILKVFLWFFPISWWYGKSIRTNLEFIADRNSLENGLDKRSYQLNLISISQQPSGSVLVNSFSKKLIKNRIKMLNKMKTKKQILSVYAILVPLLTLISVAVSVKAQSRNEKVKQVIVLSDDGLKPEDVKIQVKNEKGEYEDLDPGSISLIGSDTLKRPSVFMFKDEKLVDGNDLTWRGLDGVHPGDIANLNVDRDGERSTVIIRYKNGKENDTIITPDPHFYGYGYSFNTEDEVLSAKELKRKIKKGEFDLKLPQNKWMDLWKKDNFKEPIDYSKYHRPLENWEGGVYRLHRADVPYVRPDINYKVFKMDSATIKKYSRPDGVSVIIPNDFRQKDVKYFQFKDSEPFFRRNADGGEIYIIPETIGKDPDVYIDGKKSTMNRLKKTLRKGTHIITYIHSDGEDMIRRYGKIVSTDGVILATKK